MADQSSLPQHVEETVCTVLTVDIALLVLAARRRVEILADRKQFTLQLAPLNERRTAKVISPVEELRRESLVIPNSVDPKAREMSDTLDARSVSKAVEGINPPNDDDNTHAR